MSPGEVVAGRFEIVGPAGSGAMGVVYRAADRISGRQVALKVLHTGARDGSSAPAAMAEARFAREADVLADLDHPGIVRYVAHGVTEEGRSWLAIEWLEGVDLAARLRAGRLGAAEAVALGQRVAEALGAAHARGVLHRDVKPSNVFLPGGSAREARVLDFGVARIASVPGATRTGAALGTPGYMAPEQVSGARDVDARADVFGLGALLFECLAGRPAFTGETVMAVLAGVLLADAPRLAAVWPEAPAALDDLLARMLSRDPAGRPADGAAVAAELAALATRGDLDDDEGAASPPPSSLGHGEVRADAFADTVGDDPSSTERADRERREGTLLGKPTPFVGREREMGLLLGLFDECAGELVGRAVVVTAAAGVGKSRLGRELGRAIEMRGSGAEIWIGRGDPLALGAPFGLCAAAIRGAAGISADEPAEAKRSKLAARVGRHLSGAAGRRVAAFVGELAGVPFPDDESVELVEARRDARLMGDQMRRAWEDLLAAETTRSPLVLVLEDLHWGDLPSVDLVGAALASLADRPFLVIALGRPEVRDRFPGLWEARSPTEVTLADLPRRAAETLARAVLGEAADPAVVDRVVAQASGNAFYLEEILRAVVSGDGDRLPGTVLAMVEARLDRLAAEDRRVLRAASVFGPSFTREGVSALAGDAPALDASLGRLVDQELVQRRGAAFSFRTSLTREAAYAMLTDADRTLGHRLAAEHLARGGEGDASLASAIGEHFERGAEPSGAAAWYARAAVLALEGSDLAGALDRAGRAQRCGAAGDALGRLFLVQAEAQRWLGDTTRAAEAARAALEHLSPGSAPAWAAVAELSVTLGKRGDAGALAALVEGVLAEPRRADERAGDAAPLYRTVVELIHAGRYPLAGRLLERLGGVKTILAGPQVPGSGPAATALVHQARAAWATCRGDVASARRETERGIEAAEAAGNLRLACLLRANLGDAYLQLGVWAEAERTSREALAVAAAMGLGDVGLVCRINLGIALASGGRAAEARATLAEATAPGVAEHHPRAFLAAAIALADACALAGDDAEAERWARAAAAGSTSIAPLAALARATLARLLLRRGAAVEALAEARAAMDLLDTLGKIEWGEARVRLAWAEALAATGDHARALAAITAARAALAARAEAVSDPDLRESFLGRVRENAETAALAEAWSRPEASEG